MKTADFASLARPFLEAEQKVAILWLDDNYCLLSFPTPAACTRLFEAWREAHEPAMSATQTETEERLTLQTVVLERFDAFERLCGMKVAKKEEPSRKREHEESVVFENKRLRIVRKIARPESEKKWCSVMWCVCTNRRVHHAQQQHRRPLQAVLAHAHVADPPHHLEGPVHRQHQPVARRRLVQLVVVEAPRQLLRQLVHHHQRHLLPEPNHELPAQVRAHPRVPRQREHRARRAGPRQDAQHVRDHAVGRGVAARALRVTPALRPHAADDTNGPAVQTAQLHHVVRVVHGGQRVARRHGALPITPTARCYGENAGEERLTLLVELRRCHQLEVEALLPPVGHVLLADGADSLARDGLLVAASAHHASPHHRHAKGQAVQDDELTATVVALDVERGVR